MSKERWQDWVSLVAGIWLFLSPWVLKAPLNGGATWSFCIVGAVIAIAAVAALAAYQLWEEWVDVMLGVLLIISPWALGFASTTTLRWNAVIVGVVVVLASGWVLSSDSGAMGKG